MERIPPRIVPAIIEFAYGDLAANPHRVGKPLARQLAGSYSARRGPYRVLYDIDTEGNRVLILRVDHRADVYRPR
jgi:mRNA-degrading endonuclease RelE of RelBE toxin-antitoxin system